jgi:hypothetical protein
MSVKINEEPLKREQANAVYSKLAMKQGIQSLSLAFGRNSKAGREV